MRPPTPAATLAKTRRRRPRDQPVVAFGVTAAPGAELTAEVSVGLCVHPAAEDSFAGLHRNGPRTWSHPSKARVVAALDYVDPARVYPAKVDPLTASNRRTVAAQLAALLDTPVERWAPRAAVRTAGGVVLVAETPDGGVALRVAAAPLEVNGTDWCRFPTHGRARALRTVPAWEVPALLAAVGKARYELVDLSELGAAQQQLWRWARRATRVLPHPEAPGLAQVFTATDCTTVPVGSIDPGSDVVHPLVAARYATTHAAPLPNGDLFPWQSLFAGRYVACDDGIVNALPPGWGKTVCAASALREAAARSSGHWSALVVAPAAVLGQWQTELTRWATELDVVVAAHRDDHAALSDNLARHSNIVGVVALEHLPAFTATFAGTLGELVVDEAAFLRNTDSHRTRAAWELRTRAGRAMALTATPSERTVDDLGAISAWATGNRTLFHGDRRLSKSEAGSPAEVLGPLLYTAPTDLEPVPPLDWEVIAVPGTADETGKVRVAIDALAGRAGLDASTAARTLMAVCASPDGPTPSTTVRAVADRCSELVATGSRPLVFCDIADATTALLAELRSKGVTVAEMTGASTPPARAAAADRFRSGTAPVGVVSSVGRLGLNLQGATHVLFLDTPLSPATMLQRAGRAARIGSPVARIPVELYCMAGSPAHAVADHLIGPAGPAPSATAVTTRQLQTLASN